MNEESRTKSRIVLINSVIARNDAISASLYDTYRLLKANQAVEVSAFCYRNDYPEVEAHIVSNVEELLFHPDFLAADILIWDFGIFYELFNAAIVGNGKARRIVRFHNVTPKQFVSHASWETIDRSLNQSYILNEVDEVWADSALNAITAQQLGVSSSRIKTIPLIVENGQVVSPLEKSIEPIRILFVGRFVSSKGVLELLEAISLLKKMGNLPQYKLTLAGNVEFSDGAYLKRVLDYIERESLRDSVSFLGTVEDSVLENLYRCAHILAIPSYHEGFCKPVIEALRAGCIPVAYSAFNLPYIVDGLGCLVPPGQIDALASILSKLIRSLSRAVAAPDQPLLSLDSGSTSVNDFIRRTHSYLKTFTYDNISELTWARIAPFIHSRESS